MHDWKELFKYKTKLGNDFICLKESYREKKNDQFNWMRIMKFSVNYTADLMRIEIRGHSITTWTR